MLEASAEQADSSVHHLVALKRFSGVKWTVVERIAWAWVLTLPATGLIGYVLARLAHQWN